MLSVIIPCYKDHRSLEHTLRGLELQRCADPFEVVLVDSSPQKYSYSGSLPIRYLHQKSRIYAGIARNIGAKAAKGEVLIFLDSKVVPEIYALKKIGKLRLENRIYSASLELSSMSSFWGRFKHLLLFAGFQNRVRAGERENLPSTFLIMSRKVFLDNEGFRDLIRQQDTEYTERLKEKGCQLYFEPSLTCELVNREDAKTLVYKVYLDGAGFGRRKKSVSYAVLLPIIGVLKFARIGLRNLWWRRDFLSIVLFIPSIIMSLVWVTGGYSSLFKSTTQVG